LLDRLDKGVAATGIELRDLGRLLSTAKELRVFLAAQREALPYLTGWLTIDQVIDRLGERLQRSIDSEGVIKDEASAQLGRLRSKVKQARQDLIQQLKRLMQVHADLLRDEYYSERDGRYVIPIRADAHRAIDGTVLDTSASGNTLFVEPRELTHASNTLRICVAEVTHEEQRILRELSGAARDLSVELRRAETACVEADVLSALTRWAKQHDAVAIVPEETPIADLRSVRHPLLVGQVEVVPNDVALEPGHALVLSGPNAGGKTVTLKCLGLAARMARAGIPLCCDAQSRIGFFTTIHSEIGDSQSIVKSLSTFSAHVLMLASILEHASDSNLVLLDEVAGGTDPEQGSALAVAYLEALLARGAAVAATTHYEALKELGNSDARFHNAAVGFDVATMLPTFRVINGVAGPSTALAVAARYGIPNAVLERAHTLIPEASRERERILEDLAAKRTEAEKLRRESARDALEQQRLRLELQAERDAVRTTFQRHLEQEYRELLGQIRTARSELDQVKQRLREMPNEKRALTQLERDVDAAAHCVSLGSDVAEAVRLTKLGSTAATQGQVSELVPGQRVHVARLGTDVEILEVPRRGPVRVRAGSVTLSVAHGDLSPARGSHTKTQPQRGNPRRDRRTRDAIAMVTPRAAPTRISQNTLDLRGERVDAALERVERFVDELLRHSEPAGYVLHGHGTGALKQAVRDHVRGLRHVVDSGPAGPEDGGDAFTLLWLER
jgi:DNA mismatch repair protein MutS2